MELYKAGQGKNGPAWTTGMRVGWSGLGLVGRRALITPNPKLKLMDQLREVMRLKQYSIRTEASYCEWVKQKRTIDRRP